MTKSIVTAYSFYENHNSKNAFRNHPYRKQLQQYVQNILITKFRKVNVRNYFDIPTSVKVDGLKSVEGGFIMTRTVSNADLQKTIQDKISREYEDYVHYNTHTSQL